MESTAEGTLRLEPTAHHLIPIVRVPPIPIDAARCVTAYREVVAKAGGTEHVSNAQHGSGEQRS